MKPPPDDKQHAKTDGDKPTQFERGPALYHGSVTEAQAVELERIVNDFLKNAAPRAGTDPYTPAIAVGDPEKPAVAAHSGDGDEITAGLFRLAAECGWSETSSRPPELYIRDKLVASVRGRIYANPQQLPDRGVAVNLARNWLDSQGPNGGMHITPKGIRTLADGVMLMDAWILEVTVQPEAQSSATEARDAARYRWIRNLDHSPAGRHHLPGEGRR